jgi:hypothetical protein
MTRETTKPPTTTQKIINTKTTQPNGPPNRTPPSSHITQETTKTYSIRPFSSHRSLRRNIFTKEEGESLFTSLTESFIAEQEARTAEIFHQHQAMMQAMADQSKQQAERDEQFRKDTIQQQEQWRTLQLERDAINTRQAEEQQNERDTQNRRDADERLLAMLNTLGLGSHHSTPNKKKRRT